MREPTQQTAPVAKEIVSTPGDEPDSSLVAALFRESHRFEFFQAVRLLERISPHRAPVGHHHQPQDEVVRFRSHVSLSFPASEIWDLEQPTSEDEPSTLTATFMGLAGMNGALPRHYASLLIEPPRRRHTAALRDFLDLFNHRFLSLFYRAWEKYRFPVAYERGGDMFSEHLFCLIGMGFPALRNRLRISDQILLYYAGLLSQRPRTASALEGMLQDYFGVPVEIQPFTGQWFLMNVDALTSIGLLGQNNRLGVDATLWERVWDPQARFRIRLGPLTFEQFVAFLPSGEAYRHLVELTRFFVGEELSFEVQPVLSADEVPWCALGHAQTSRLGWAMWLRTAPLTDDTTQPVFPARVAQAGPESWDPASEHGPAAGGRL